MLCARAVLLRVAERCNTPPRSDHVVTGQPQQLGTVPPCGADHMPARTRASCMHARNKCARMQTRPPGPRRTANALLKRRLAPRPPLVEAAQHESSRQRGKAIAMGLGTVTGTPYAYQPRRRPPPPCPPARSTHLPPCIHPAIHATQHTTTHINPKHRDWRPMPMTVHTPTQALSTHFTTRTNVGAVAGHPPARPPPSHRPPPKTARGPATAVRRRHHLPSTVLTALVISSSCGNAATSRLAA